MNTEATTAAPVKAPKAAPKKAAPKAKKAPAPKKEAPAKKSASAARPAPSAGAPSTKSASADKPDPALAKLDKDLARSKERLAKPKAPAKPAPKKAVPKKPAGVTYKSLAASHTGASTIDHPVKAMWDLCDKMKDSKRKDVIAAAVGAGIGYYTARTQYQLWLTAFRNS